MYVGTLLSDFQDFQDFISDSPRLFRLSGLCFDAFLTCQEATHELPLGHGALCTMEGKTQRCRANGFLENTGGKQEVWRKAGPFFVGLDVDIHILI